MTPSAPTDTAGSPPVDRAALVRDALRRVVAERGFHGASMSAVAKAAGVATGTAYVHYESKDELVIAAYLELKQQLGLIAAAAIGLVARCGSSVRERTSKASSAHSSE